METVLGNLLQGWVFEKHDKTPFKRYEYISLCARFKKVAAKHLGKDFIATITAKTFDADNIILDQQPLSALKREIWTSKADSFEYQASTSGHRLMTIYDRTTKPSEIGLAIYTAFPDEIPDYQEKFESIQLEMQSKYPRYTAKSPN